MYNWTVEDVLDWLAEYVELPQYVHNFKVNAVDGRMLPRYAEQPGSLLGKSTGESLNSMRN